VDNSLAEDDVIIRVGTGISAGPVIVGVTVGIGAVILEVHSGRTALAHVRVVELAATAVLVRVESEARTLARNDVTATADLQIIGASGVQVPVAARRGTPIATASLPACGSHLRRKLGYF
jgi:hypothetical protein